MLGFLLKGAIPSTRMSTRKASKPARSLNVRSWILNSGTVPYTKMSTRTASRPARSKRQELDPKLRFYTEYEDEYQKSLKASKVSKQQ